VGAESSRQRQLLVDERPGAIEVAEPERVGVGSGLVVGQVAISQQ
jgi:hypothetical protein